MTPKVEEGKLQGNNSGRVSSCTVSLQTDLGLPASLRQNEPDFFAVNCLMRLMGKLKRQKATRAILRSTTSVFGGGKMTSSTKEEKLIGWDLLPSSWLVHALKTCGASKGNLGLAGADSLM
ncbi:hypothetical protein OIU84_007494 [Salix udensis]|uniref:Uncharacterized protein n=1 Tax=Salix udensis TaxID=889485 RepID=A0AAD6JT80_9ROSI|nr:hypothetical protein OIU84_007494 [Salix udensis]